MNIIQLNFNYYNRVYLNIFSTRKLLRLLHNKQDTMESVLVEPLSSVGKNACSVLLIYFNCIITFYMQIISVRTKEGLIKWLGSTTCHCWIKLLNDEQNIFALLHCCMFPKAINESISSIFY